MLSQPAKLTLEVNMHVCRSSYCLPRGIEWCLASVEKHQSLLPRRELTAPDLGTWPAAVEPRKDANDDGGAQEDSVLMPGV